MYMNRATGSVARGSSPGGCVLSQVDLRHMDEKAGSNIVEVGVDLSEFYMSVEWDILEVPAVR